MSHIGVLAKFLADEAASVGNHVDLVARAKAINWPSGARMFEQRAVGAIEATFGTSAGTGIELTGLVGSLAGQFYSAAVAQQSPQWPHHSRLGVVPQIGFSGAETAEGDPAPVAFLSNGIVTVEPAKVAAVLVYTLEAVALRNFATLVQGELEKAIGRGLDAAFYSRLAPGSDGGFSAGSSALTDLRTLTGMVVSTTGQRLLFASSVDTAQRIATMAPGGLELFPLAGLVGVQEIKGVSNFPSDAIPSGSLLAIDPSGITAVIDDVTMSASNAAALSMSGAPEMPNALSSMFQSGCIAVMATCRFHCAQIRDSNVSAECVSIGWTEA